MAKLFNVDIAAEVNRAMGGGFLSATLTQYTAGTRTSGQLTGGVNPTSTGYACKGIVEDYTEGQVDGTLVLSGDRKILLLGASIASSKVPAPGDEVTIDGGTYRVVRVTSDPASATYQCQARRV